MLTSDGRGGADRALAALAKEFDRRLALIAPRDRTELRRILLALLARAAGDVVTGRFRASAATGARSACRG
ncbi:hypothetical protein ACFS27_26310 [Promicromonospora vindobonensis]|uniref:Uncharacterized protein n=1 Tax=Promicromonospora vindobonensis TaxID=195748 RepID=A0ABW5W1Q4_9MICO